MTNVDIDSHIEPITYIQCYMDERFFNFILNNRSLPSLIVQNIFKHYKKRNEKNFKKIFLHIDSYQKYEAITFCGFRDNLVTVLTLTKNYYISEDRIIGQLLIEEYMQKYYIRYKISEETSYLERVRIQCERIDKLGRILKLIFRYRKNISLHKDILDMILKKICKKNLNYFFLYINPLSSKLLLPYIKKDEMKYLDDIEYGYALSESNESGSENE